MLGILANKMTGKFHGDLIRKKTFGPLGMTTACILTEADILPNRAGGCRLVKSELKDQDWLSPTLSTTADGALYLTMLYMSK